MELDLGSKEEGNRNHNFQVSGWSYWLTKVSFTERWSNKLGWRRFRKNEFCFGHY